MNKTARPFIYLIVICGLLIQIQDKSIKQNADGSEEYISSENSLTHSIGNWVTKSLQLNSLRRLQSNVNDDREL